MTAPLYLLDSGALADSGAGAEVVIEGAEGHHAATVARLQPGARVLLADNSGWLGQGTVASVTKGRVHAVLDEVTHHPQPDVTFTLAQALAKADRDLLAIEVATELGVDRVIPWQANRSVVRWRGERGLKARRKWHNTLMAATKQARRSRVPSLGEAVDLASLAEHVKRADVAIALHENAPEPLAALSGGDLPTTGEVLLIVGPEGGISDDELTALVAAGASPRRLGDTVLRTSTAGSAAIALLSALSRWRA
ncbi:MAG: 16S rRNA (uracil(1498)-N(3))-methyltransferase [Ornithinimicrobium sp.]